MSNNVWSELSIISWTQILLDSFHHFLDYDLICRNGSKEEQAQTLFFADFVVVSHGTETDPILNYGNQTALKLWSMNWEQLIQTPSRLTAEPVNRQTRQAMLNQAANNGYIDNYSGIRIASNGIRFMIEKAIIWNLIDQSGNKCGQAATFSTWKFLKES